MSSFRLLETGDEPLLKVGDHIHFRGKEWDESLREKTFEIVKAQVTHLRIDHGIFSTSGNNSKLSFDTSDYLRPNNKDTLFEIRMSIKGAGVVYIRYPEGQIRGGLEKKAYTTPDPDNVTTRLLGMYTEEDTENHRLQVFEAYGKGPDFEIRNFLVDSKIVFDLIINEMKIREAPDWTGEVLYIDDDKYMGW